MGQRRARAGPVGNNTGRIALGVIVGGLLLVLAALAIPIGVSVLFV